jgi:hypothetical protein
MTAVVTAVVFFLKEDLGVSETVYGLVLATWMIGMVIGALVPARRVPASVLATGGGLVFAGEPCPTPAPVRSDTTEVSRGGPGPYSVHRSR